MTIEQDLFNSDVLFNPVKLPPSYTIRPLRRDDYHRGFIELLSQLSVVGDCAEETFQKRFDVLKQVGTSFIIVMEQDDGRVVASATLLLEHKFLHDCGNVGHIEDVVVHDSQRGKSLGKRLIEQLHSIADALKCYKIILNCHEKNVSFYEKCGLDKTATQMAHYF